MKPTTRNQQQQSFGAPTMVETSGGIRFFEPTTTRQVSRPPAPAPTRAPRKR